MDEDPAGGVRRKKDSSLVRAAELVRDGKASAMVSAGNTGATMASALLRMGRLPGVVRPCIATPLPRLGRTPAVLVDAGANAECTPAMLVQFAQMGAAYVSARFGTAAPSVGLLSIGEEPTKGTPLVKETHGLLVEAAKGPGQAAAGENGGGVRVHRQPRGPGPAALAGRRHRDGRVHRERARSRPWRDRCVSSSTPCSACSRPMSATSEAARVLLPHLLPVAAEFEPENTGGAMLLGTDGVCVISHGSSNATAMMNAVRVAHECATRGLADHVAAAVRTVE